MYNILSATKATNLLVRSDRREFDLIVSHDWLSAMAGIMCKKTLKKPFVFHLHSVEEGRVGDGSRTIKNLERLAARTSDLMITVSYSMRDQLVSLGYEEGKVRVIHNGVDEEKYDPTALSWEEVAEFRERLGIDDAPTILFIGRLAWVKGVDTLIRAMPIIRGEIPDAKLIILGKGEQEGLIKSMISHLGIQDSVRLHLKYVDEKERILHYAAADIAVFPSKYEPFGIVCTEAMSMEKPVIVGAKGVSGLKEQVVCWGASRCGAHVDPDDPYDIAKFAIEFLGDENLRKKLGKNARKHVLERFTLDKVAKEIAGAYEEIIEITSP
jgi:glycosyltransferase involved in cell wall biosynthesis